MSENPASQQEGRSSPTPGLPHSRTAHLRHQRTTSAHVGTSPFPAGSNLEAFAELMSGSSYQRCANEPSAPGLPHTKRSTRSRGPFGFPADLRGGNIPLMAPVGCSSPPSPTWGGRDVIHFIASFYFIYSFSLLAHLGFRPAVLRAPLPHGGRVLGPAVVSEQREDEGWEEGPRFAAGGGGGGMQLSKRITATQRLCWLRSTAPDRAPGNSFVTGGERKEASEVSNETLQ